MAEMASKSDDVLTERVLNRKTPAAGKSIPRCRNKGYDFAFATVKKFTAQMACFILACVMVRVGVEMRPGV